MKTQTVVLTKTKDCKGSVRFDVPKTTPPTLTAIDNVYVSRSMPGINEATEISVTITVTNPI